ncbi:MAG: hypothetical protein A07HR60_00310 [uncultured archaeon A07HR60]|nr:MAG: hypothetical protein A07HR60_00310 [uncultured archaeon A07HR60]
MLELRAQSAQVTPSSHAEERSNGCVAQPIVFHLGRQQTTISQTSGTVPWDSYVFRRRRMSIGCLNHVDDVIEDLVGRCLTVDIGQDTLLAIVIDHRLRVFSEDAQPVGGDFLCVVITLE